MVMKTIKRNASLVIGLAIPLLVVLFLAVSIYLPQFFVKPQTNFLYFYNDDVAYSGLRYSVQNGKLIKNKVSAVRYLSAYQPSSLRGNDDVQPDPRLYIYHVANDQSTAISFKEAQQLNLDASVESPDGFKVVRNYSYGLLSFLMGARNDYNARYLEGHNISKKLVLPLSSYRSNFHFLGWIRGQ